MIFDLNNENEKNLEFITSIKKLAKDEALYTQNDTDTDVYILNKGKCGVYVDGEFITEISQSGAIIGESAALFKQPRSATIIALEECELTRIPGEYIDNVILANPEIGLNLLKTIANRLHNTSKIAAKLQKTVFKYKKEIEHLKGQKERAEEYKLGELFYKTGTITEKQLQTVLKIQEESRKKGNKKSIGEILINQKYATLFQVMQMTRLQQELKDEQEEKKITDQKTEDKINNENQPI